MLRKSCLLIEIKSKNKSENQASLVLASWKFHYKYQAKKEEFNGLLFSIRTESLCLNFQVARVHRKRRNTSIMEVRGMWLLGNMSPLLTVSYLSFHLLQILNAIYPKAIPVRCDAV